MTLSLGTVAIVLAAVTLGATLQRVSGTGMGLVVAPLLAVLLGAAPGVLLANATTAVSALLLTIAVRRAVDWRRAVLIGACAVPGAVLGALVVRSVPPAALQVLVGSVVLLALGASTLAAALGRLPEVRRWWVTPLAGLLGAVFNTTAGVAAPVMVVHARLVRWAQTSFAATMQPVYLTFGGLSVLSKTVLTPVEAWTPPWWLVGGAVAAVLVGIALGGALSTRVSTRAAGRAAVVLAALGGAAAVVRGLLAL